jgi:hypothetical protein
MQAVPIVSCVEETSASLGADLIGWHSTIRCYLYRVLTPNSWQADLPRERELTVQAMTLLMRLDTQLREARADWNQDRFRRLMRLRPKAVARLRRRWEKLNPSPRIPVGSLRRRYHANIAGHLYPVSQD